MRLEPGTGGDAMVQLVFCASLDDMLQKLERRQPVRQHLMQSTSSLWTFDSAFAGDDARFLLRFDTRACHEVQTLCLRFHKSGM